MLNTWLLDSHLKLNPSKCKYMIISCRKNQVLHSHLYLGADQLEKVDCFKYLGLMLSCGLYPGPNTLTLHICSKAKRLLDLLYRHYHHAPPQALLEMYLTLIDLAQSMQALYGIPTCRKTKHLWRICRNLQ